MNLSEELARVRKYVSGEPSPPSNEANTCSWAIRPLLQKCGYDHHEIDEQAHDGAGNIPDFTLLPHTPHTWFLEAKRWSVALADTHVNQAINYANIQGRRWVVVSNGREWRLYDNYLNQVPPSERLVVAAKLDCGRQVEALLAALSRESALAGRLEAFVRDAALRDFLARELADRNGAVLAAIAEAARQRPALASVTATDIHGYFAERFASSVPVSPPAPKESAPVSAPPPIAEPIANPRAYSRRFRIFGRRRGRPDAAGTVRYWQGA